MHTKLLLTVFFKGVAFTRKSLDIRLLTNDKTPETDDLLMLVYVKRNGDWLLSAGQNTVIDPEAAKHNPVSGKTNWLIVCNKKINTLFEQQ